MLVKFSLLHFEQEDIFFSRSMCRNVDTFYRKNPHILIKTPKMHVGILQKVKRNPSKYNHILSFYWLNNREREEANLETELLYRGRSPEGEHATAGGLRLLPDTMSLSLNHLSSYWWSSLGLPCTNDSQDSPSFTPLKRIK